MPSGGCWAHRKEESEAEVRSVYGGMLVFIFWVNILISETDSGLTFGFGSGNKKKIPPPPPPASLTFSHSSLRHTFFSHLARPLPLWWVCKMRCNLPMFLGLFFPNTLYNSKVIMGNKIGMFKHFEQFQKLSSNWAVILSLITYRGKEKESISITHLILTQPR